MVPHSHRGRRNGGRKEEEAAKRRRKRAEKRKARLSCICSVAGGRTLNREREREREREERNIIALFRPDASPRRGGRNKYRDGAEIGGRLN